MILRVVGEGDTQELIECNIGSNNDEEGFLAMNPTFIQSDNVPYSLSGHYRYDANGDIVVDDAYELKELKSNKMNVVQHKFNDMMFNGQFECSLGFLTDNRRGDGKDDKDNVGSLIDLGQEPVYFRDVHGDFHSLSIQDLITLKQEMIMDGLGKYQWKWVKENEIMSASSIEELESVEI